MSIPILNQPEYGLRGEVASLVKREVRRLIFDALNDQLFHAEIVAAGRFTFRGAFTKQMGAAFAKQRGPCDDLADVVYQFLDAKWREKYPDMSAALFLDKVRIIAPPSQQEIDDAWELEIASDERTLNTYYEGSARVRKGTDFGARSTPKKVH